jgi:CheY-like chemotaxis protein
MKQSMSSPSAASFTQVFAQEVSMPGSRRVLIVDDDRNLTTLVSTLLRSYGFEVMTAADGESALGTLAGHDIDVVVLDLRMPGMDGRAVFREMRARGHTAPVLIASAYGARPAQQELGAEASIEKPFDPETLADVVMRLLEAD